MGAVWMLGRGEVRRGWRGLVALALLVGLVGAVVLGAAAGARRTASVLDRFAAFSRPADVSVASGQRSPAEVRAVERIPGVEAIAPMVPLSGLVGDGKRFVPMVAALDDRLFRQVDRVRVVRGRLPDPEAPLELLTTEGTARANGLQVGDTVPIAFYTPEQIARFKVEEPAGEPAPEGPSGRFRLVGIGRGASDLEADPHDPGVLVLTPAYYRAHGAQVGSFTGSVVQVRVRGGRPVVARVVGEVRDRFGSDPDFGVQTFGGVRASSVQDAIDVLTTGLVVFAAIAALTGLVAVGLVLGRRIGAGGAQQPTLRALGLTRRARAAAAALAVLPVALGGAALAVVGAWLASPLLPFGVARDADPSPGLRFDAPVLLLGFVGILLLLVALAAIAAWRLSGAAVDVDADRAARPSAAARALARSSLGPAPAVGVRMALEPGRGRTAVPARSSLLGATVGVLGVTAVVVFGAGLDHLVATPRLAGWSWDVRIVDTRARSAVPGRICVGGTTRVARDPAVADLADVCYLNIQLEGRAVTAWGFTDLVGHVGPTIARGRAPRTRAEVALGRETLAGLGKHIGDSVRAAGPRGPVGYRIVGQVALADLDDPQPLADGAAFTGAGLYRIDRPRDANGSHELVARWARGTDVERASARLDRLPGVERPVGASPSNEVERLRAVDRLPLALAVVLGAIALLAVGNLLVTSVRRRQPDLAVLKTLGFDRRQVMAAVAWQATTVSAVGLVVGVPLGVVVGRLVWRAVAEGVGVPVELGRPWLAIAVLVPAVVLVANVVAFLPARAAARTRPAVVLRSE